jgi:hypothetical protein
MAAIKITVATPAFGDMLFTPYVQSLLRLQHALYQRKWAMLYKTIAYAYVGDARNYLLTDWYDKSDATHLLFVDADMGFEPQLVIDMIEFNKPVVGAIYTKRQIDLKRLAALAAKGESVERAIARAHDFILRPLHGRQPRRIKGFMEVEGCGTGVMLIQRAAVDTMLKTLPNINDTNAKKTAPSAFGLDRLIRAFDVLNVEGVPLVDDYAFCYRWQALCKGELWARADQSITHIGLHRFSSRYADAGFGGPQIVGRPIDFGKLLARKSTAGTDKAAAQHERNGPRKSPAALSATGKAKPGSK